MFVVVAYDIANDRRRMRLRAFLLRFGDAVQESVFECDLAPRDLRAGVAGIIRPSVDKVRLYSLCQDCVDRIEVEAGKPASGPAVHVV